MNRKLKYALGIALIGIVVCGLVVLKYVNKPANDFLNETPKATYTFKEIMDKTSIDTSSIGQLIDQLVAIKGTVKKVTKDSLSTTIELGDSNSTSSIICQIDSRHLESCSSLKEGQSACIKGKIAGFTVDTDLGLGNTMQMNYCSLENK